MMTPHEVFNAVVESTGDRTAAIRSIREQFGLDLRQAKEVMIQAEGVAASLDEHEERIADALEGYLKEQQRAEMPVYLHRAITISEYESELGFDQLKGWPLEKWSSVRVEIEDVLAQGGELWMWEYRNEFGLTGVTGLAVV